MSLEVFWFILIAVMFVAFFFLEGFDFGVGILQFFLGKNEKERGTYIYTIAPHWNANEVWLLVAGGSMFAAFPRWYATFFSALYLPFVILLLALIVRGGSFEIRHRANIPKLRFVLDVLLVISNFALALLTSIAMANLAIGIPIDSNGNFIGSVLDLVHPFALFCGILGLSLFITNGALFLSLKIEGELQIRAYRVLKPAVITSVVLFAITAALVWEHNIIYVAALAFILGAAVFIFNKSLKVAFFMVALCTICSVAGLFLAMYPNVLVSSIAENSITIANAASSHYTLKIMSFTAAIFVPIILAYQIWSYYIFHKRINPRNANLEV